GDLRRRGRSELRVGRAGVATAGTPGACGYHGRHAVCGEGLALLDRDGAVLRHARSDRDAPHQLRHQGAGPSVQTPRTAHVAGGTAEAVTGPVDWSLAERVALRVCGKEPLAESYHASSLVPDFA